MDATAINCRVYRQISLGQLYALLGAVVYEGQAIGRLGDII